MEYTNEDIVTRLLASNEFIHCNPRKMFSTKPKEETLGSFLEKVKNAPSQYDEKYIFIK